jgi:hypothetical protein
MPGDNVCIGVGALAPVPTQPTPDPVPQPPKPKPYPAMPGVTGKCTKFYQIVENDVCIGITEKFDIGLNDFMSWNSGVSPDCKNLWVGYYVCVGV